MVKHHIMILSYIVPPLVLLHTTYLTQKPLCVAWLEKIMVIISAHGHKYESCLGYMNVDY